MARARQRGRMRLVLSRENADTFRHLAVVWFAEAAAKLTLNTSLSLLQVSDFSAVIDRVNSFVGGGQVNPSSFLPLTRNDPKDLTLQDSLEVLRKALEEGVVQDRALPPAFSLEYLEYVRSLFPKPTEAFSKRKNIYVKSDLLALAVIGAYLTNYHFEVRDNNVHYYYILIDVPQISVIDLQELHRRMWSAMRMLHAINASPIARYVSAAALATLYVRDLVEKSVILTHIHIVGRLARRPTQTTRRSVLMSFDHRDLSGLARDIRSLHWVKAVTGLVDVMVSREGARDFGKGFLEFLAKAIYIWHSIGDEQEIYRVLRRLTSEDFEDKARKAFGNAWDEIRNDLIDIKL